MKDKIVVDTGGNSSYDVKKQKLLWDKTVELLGL
jgi:hypothetical protein